MTLIKLPVGSDPAYVAVASDVIENKVAGASKPGEKLYLSDTGKTFIIKDDLTLSEYMVGKIDFNPDSKTGQIKNVQVQFSATPGTVMQITNLPAWAKYMKLYPQSGVVAFAFDENPAIDAADVGSAGSINFATNASIGGIAVSSSWEIRTPVFGTTIRLVSDTANAKCWIELTSGV
jgi:hypothetical protein